MRMREEISAKMLLNESYIQRIRFESYHLSTSIHQACGKQTEESYVCSNFIKNVPGTQVLDEDLLNSALVNAGRYPISYRASRYIHTLVPMLVWTITYSLLPRGYSQFASFLRRDPNKGPVSVR
jgi:hypothetical protein